MEANRRFAPAMPFGLGVLISLTCFGALLVGIARLLPWFLAFSMSRGNHLVLDAVIIVIVASALRRRRRQPHAPPR